jgi:hypothetical protein
MREVLASIHPTLHQNYCYTKREKYDPVPLGFRSEIHRKDPNHDKLDEHLKETDNPVFLGLGTINYYYQDNAVCIV